MKTFREQLEQDFEQTFFNLDEFAETHTIDGKEIPVVVDNETLMELTLGKSADTDGIFQDSKMIYIRKKDLDVEPVIDQLMEFDREIYQVANVLEEVGGYSIILKGNAS